MSQYEPIVAADFPTARSIAAAARENPAAFAWHVGHNARLLPLRLAWFWELADYLPQLMRVGLASAAGAVLVVGAFALAWRPRRLSPRLRGWLPIWIPVGASFAAAVLLIHPRDHYLVPFSFFVVATLASAWSAISRRPERRIGDYASAAGLAAAIALLALLPTYRRGALPSLVEARGAPPPTDWPGRLTVDALRELDLRGERVFLEPNFSRAVFARIPFRSVHRGKKDGPFSEFLRKEDIDVVIVTKHLREDARYRDDPAFRSFLADDGDHLGFILHPVPRAATIIAFRPK
jgi:hypothetical protein